MKDRDLNAAMRAKEWFHSLTLPPGSWAVIRVDGRSFAALTERHFDKPFDPRFCELMVATAHGLLEEFDAPYVSTHSDEISVVLPPAFDLFGRELEKLVSISAAAAAAAFTHASGIPAPFDSRVWLGNTAGEVVDYLSWRQGDAARCALNGWCYWTLRGHGLSAREATRRLEGAGTAEKNELLYAHGVNFNDTPAWQRRGVGLWWRADEHQGHDPVRGVDVTVQRRRVHAERELPMREDYRALVAGLVDPLGSPPR